MRLFGFGKKKDITVDTPELVGLEADLKEYYAGFIAKVQADFNKGKGVKNFDGSDIKFLKGSIDIDPKAPVVQKQLRRINKIRDVINLRFYIENSQEAFDYYISIVPVDDNGVHRWCIFYNVRKQGISSIHARKFNSLNEDGLFFTVKELVIENSCGSFKETLDAAKRELRSSLK